MAAVCVAKCTVENRPQQVRNLLRPGVWGGGRVVSSEIRVYELGPYGSSDLRGQPTDKNRDNQNIKYPKNIREQN